MKRLMILTMLLTCSAAFADVVSTHNKHRYACNGSTTEFDFTFDVMGGDTSDVVVILRDSSGNETKLTEDSDYTVSATNNDYRAGPGGTVTTTDTYASGYTLVVYRSEDTTHSATYSSGGKMDTGAIKNSIDECKLNIQDIYEILGRCLKFPVSDSSALSAEFPTSNSRASTFPYFGNTGAVTTAAGVTAVVVSAFMETVLDDANPSDAQTTLGISSFAQTVLDDASGLAALTTMGGIGVINVKTFGAVGDGKTDDTTAVQAAITYCKTNTTGPLYFPIGTYSVNETLTITQTGLWICGASKTATIIDAADSFTGSSIFDFSSGTPAFVHISDMRINGNGHTSEGLIGIHFDNQQGTVLERLYIRDCGYGIKITDGSTVTIDSCFIYEAYNGIDLSSTKAKGGVVGVHLRRTVSESCDNYALYMDWVFFSVFESLWIEMAADEESTGAIYIDDCYCNTFIGGNVNLAGTSTYNVYHTQSDTNSSRNMFIGTDFREGVSPKAWFNNSNYPVYYINCRRFYPDTVTGEYSTSLGGSGVVCRVVNYDDDSPVTICSPAPWQVITDCYVEVVTAWDGTGASFDVGDAHDTDGFLPNASIDLTSVSLVPSDPNNLGDYLFNSNALRKIYSSRTAVIATFSKGTGASTGKCKVYIKYDQIRWPEYPI